MRQLTSSLLIISIVLFAPFVLSAQQYQQQLKKQEIKNKKLPPNNFERDEYQSISTNDILQIPAEYSDKICSGKLLGKVSRDIKLGKTKKKISPRKVIIYFESYPNTSQISELESTGVTLYQQTWTPPAYNHPLGFFVASMYSNRFLEILPLEFVKKIDTGENLAMPENRVAVNNNRAALVWEKGYTGNGIKMCVIDSGLDLAFQGNELPAAIEVKDYYDFPNLDDDVANSTTGHGTHVTGSALGRGFYSANHYHVNNGVGSFKGSAPGADLVFLKIGGDASSSASSAAIIAAWDAAVNIYNADVITMSYGGWDTYHDGSEATSQKADWVYSQGVPIFLSAGNSANDDRHYSGTVSGNSSTDFIQINVNPSASDKTKLAFNLVWHEGTGSLNDLTLEYYDTAQQLLESTNYATTTSTRNTRSEFSFVDSFLPQGVGTYYVRVINNSASEQMFHLYEDWWNYDVIFPNADPDYTIGSYAAADYSFAVGAYNSNITVSDADGMSWWYGGSYHQNNIALFSSRGPRVDGYMKPNACGPGHQIISLKDNDVYTTSSGRWIDDDGLSGGSSHYYRNIGTSMATPHVAGAAALYLEANPGASPQQVYSALMNNTNASGQDNLPNSTWGYGRVDAYAAIFNDAGPIIIDGSADEPEYETIAQFTSGRNGTTAGSLGEIRYYADGIHMYVGITGQVDDWNHLMLFMDFDGVAGRGTNTLGGFGEEIFAYTTNVKLDMDADFALSFFPESAGNSGILCAHRFGSSTPALDSKRLARTNTLGRNTSHEIGSIFGGNGEIIYGYNENFSLPPRKNQNTIMLAPDNGVEYRIDISAFGGVAIDQKVRFFAVISAANANLSNECIPGDPGPTNPGDGADFSAIPNEDFFTSWQILTEPLVLTAPVLTSPTDNAENVSANATLLWQAVDNATEYHIQVSTDETFITITEEDTSFNGILYNTIFLDYGINYFWRIKAKAGDVESDWSAVWRFTTEIPVPPKVLLTSPADGATELDLNPVLQWQAADRAIDYILGVSEFEDMSSLVVNESSLSATEYTVQSGIQYNTTYYWRIRARNVTGAGEFSDVWSFTTLLPVPDVPVVKSPLHDFSTSQTSITFVWNSVWYSRGYDIEVYSDPQLSTLYWSSSAVQDTNITHDNFELGEYYWRVRATNTSGESNWTNALHFSVISNLPEICTLVSPLDQAENVAINPLLLWNEADKADSYTIELYEGSVAPIADYIYTGVIGTSYQLPNLLPDLEYYWHVKGVNTSGDGEWSQMWKFKTELLLPETPVQLLPLDNATDVALMSQLVWGKSGHTSSYSVEVYDDPGSTYFIFDTTEVADTSITVKLEEGSLYYWRIQASNRAGESNWTNLFTFTTILISGVTREAEIPDKYNLFQNYPNPFNPTTTIKFAVPAAANVDLVLFESSGKMVEKLVNQHLVSGTYSVQLNANKLASGIYFIRMQTAEYNSTIKLLLLK